MALDGIHDSLGVFVVIFVSFISIVATSRYCDVEYECYKSCTRSTRSYTSCGFLNWDRCSQYRSTAYPCKSVCQRKECCNGYTGTYCSTPTPCDDVQSLPDLVRRARNYQGNGDTENDPFINDEYLGPGWFRVGDYRMPDSNTMPQYSFCGTKQPIYIKGTHPDITTSTDDSPVSLVACELYTAGGCENELSIDVRQCGSDTQYYLQRTSSLSGYCFDPPNIINTADFDEAPTDVAIGNLKVNPKLKFRQEENINGVFERPYLQFECFESPTVDRSAKNLLFSTYWFVESTLLKAFERQDHFMTITETDLMDSGYQLGINIRCGVCVSTSLTGFQTVMKSSEDFFAGVEVEPNVINMAKEDTASIILRPTVPFGCYAAVGDNRTERCSHSISMQYPEVSNTKCEIDVTYSGSVPMVNSLQEKCGVEIEFHEPVKDSVMGVPFSSQAQTRFQLKHYVQEISIENDMHSFINISVNLFLRDFYPHQAKDDSALEMEPVSMILTSPYFSDSDPTEYRLSLKTKNGGTHEIWKNVFLSEIQLKIKYDNKYKNKMCYSHVDPHMKTADGRPYENNDYAGSFILYKHDTGIQVQMRTTACNYNRAYCACAVAVRAGGDVFLINLCGGLRFIDMTSCKDGGVLTVQKYSENRYQVQTNIGTLVKIDILSGKYRNLMNIDIYMAPKDYNRIKGLCGTFDGSSSNDYHNRDGATVSRLTFLAAWQITNSDINLLEPSCSVDVSTWTENSLHLYCTCNCYDDTCKTTEETATCSPSQYVNCSVIYTKTSDLCQDYEKRCSRKNHAKRSSFYTDPDIEMERRAALAEQPHKFVVKREESMLITEEMARSGCSNHVLTDTIENNSNLLGGFNTTQAIEECTWDVHTGQDEGWMMTHKQAADSAIQIGYKRDANYTLSHLEELKEFNMQSCPYNCNGNGICQEQGTCTCNGTYFGPDCGYSKSNGPTIEDVEGGGLCDQRYGSECKCFSVQTEALLETFKCRMVRQKKMLSGKTQVIGSELTEGRYRNLYNGECCFAEGRRKRSSDTDIGVLHYLYNISLSNDGQNFGPISVAYVFDSLCLGINTDSDGNVYFTVKSDTCLIDGYCYELNNLDISNDCFKCDPSNSQYNWTQGCVSSPSDDEDVLNPFVIAAIVGGAFVGITITTMIAIYCIKKGTNKSSSVNASLEFPSGQMVSREPSKVLFNVQNLTYGQTF